MSIFELYLKELIMVQKIHRELVGGQNPVDLAQLYNNFSNRRLTAPNANQNHRQRPVQMGTNCANFENCLENCQLGTNERPSNFVVHPSSVLMPRAHFFTPSFVNNNSSTFNVSTRSKNAPKNIVQNAASKYFTITQILSQSEQKMIKNYAEKINHNKCAGTSSNLKNNNSGINGEIDDAFVIDVESMQIFDQPGTSTSFDQPGTSTSFDQPGTLTSFDQPGTSTSFDQPGTLTSFDQPGTSTSFDQPGTSTSSFDQPGTSTSFDQAGTSTSFDQRGTSTSFDQPGTSTSFDQPGTSTSFDQRGTSTSFDQPGTSTGFDQPGTSTSFDQPGTSTSFDQPGTSTSFDQRKLNRFDKVNLEASARPSSGISFGQHKMNGFDQPDLDEINFESVGTSKSFDQKRLNGFDQDGSARELSTTATFDHHKINALGQDVGSTTTFDQHKLNGFDQKNGSVRLSSTTNIDQQHKFNELDQTVTTFGQHKLNEFDQDGSAETSATFDQHKTNGFDQIHLDEINSEISETSTSCPTFDDNWTIETEETKNCWKNCEIKVEFVNDETKTANFGQFYPVAIKEEILETSEFDEMIANEALLMAEATENAKRQKMAQFNAKNHQIEKGKNAIKKCARHEEKIDVKVGKCEWAECDQEFANDNQLYDHIRITHIGELNANKNEMNVKNCGEHYYCIDDAAAAADTSRFACKWKNCDHSPRRGDAQRKFDWLLNHIFVWHLPKAETHICVFVECKMRFKKLTALTAHLHTVHAERLTPKKRGQKRPIKKGNDSDDDNLTKVQKKERRSEEKRFK